MAWKTPARTYTATIDMLAASADKLMAGQIATTLGFYSAGDGGGATWVVQAAAGETWVDTGLGFSMDTLGRIKLGTTGYRLAPLGTASGVIAGAYGMRAGASYVNTVLLQTLVTYSVAVGAELILPGGTGAYYTGEVTVPAGATITGRRTLLQLVVGARSVFYVLNPTDTAIRTIRFKGNLADEAAMAYTSMASVTGTQRGVYWEETTSVVLSRLRIDGCDFLNFDRAGIEGLASGLAAAKRSLGPQITRCRAQHCAVGIWLGTRAEYVSISDFNATRCYAGARVEVGNNVFTGCHFDENVVGFDLIDGTNSGHGSAVGCTFNHNASHAIRATSVTLGFAFVGCQVYDGIVHFDACSAIVFTGGNLGLPLTLRFNGGGRNTISMSSYSGGTPTVEHNYGGPVDSTVFDNVTNAAGTALV